MKIGSSQARDILLGTLQREAEIYYEVRPDRHAWLQVLRGSVSLNGQALHVSDGAAVTDETRLDVVAAEPAEIMLFDLN